MNLLEYQLAAASTAEAPAYDTRYHVPGIVSEFGELQGHHAKAFWHDRDPSDTARHIVLEYGDLLWLTAIALQACGVTKESQFPVHIRQPRTYPNQAPEAAIAHAIHRIYMTWLDEDPSDVLATYWAHLWVTLLTYAQDITGQPADTVMQANLDKLADRAARGQLRGDGDDR